MDNNFDNTPKDNDTLTQPSDEAGIQGQTPDSNTAGSGADAGQKYTDPNAGQQTNYQQYQYASQNDPNQQNAYNYNQQNNGYQYNQQGQNNGYNYGQQNQNGSYNYSQSNQNGGYNYNQNQGYNYQDNYSYNTGNHNQVYEPGQDTSPMSMGDWMLTLLAAMIPCVGIVLYFVWAFSKTTNVNRRNFCRAQLIIMGVVLVIYLIFIALFGTMIFRSGFYY